MKHSLTLTLLLCIAISSSYAKSPSSVVIDGVEYAPVPNSKQENYTIPQSSLGGSEDCWYEQVPIPTVVNESQNLYGAIVGGIIGGVIGNQFGSGRGRTAATIGGAALGTALGSNTPQSQPQQYQTIRKCNTSR